MQSVNGNQQQAQPQPQISKASKAAIIAELQAAISTLQTQDANVGHLIECRQKIDFAGELASLYLRDPSTFNPLGPWINNPYASNMMQGQYPGMGGVMVNGMGGVMGGGMFNAGPRAQQMQMHQMYPQGYGPQGGNVHPQYGQGSAAPQQQSAAGNHRAGVHPQEQNDAANSSSGHLSFELSESFPNIGLRPEVINGILTFGILDQSQSIQHIGYITPENHLVQVAANISPATNAKIENIVQTFILDYIFGPKEFPISSEQMQTLWDRVKKTPPAEMDQWMIRSADRNMNRDVNLMHKEEPAQPE